MYLTLPQTAKKLDRTERQVRYLLKLDILVPVNQDTYKRDGGYRFSPESIDQIKEKLNFDGISLRKAAEIVGITPQYLNSLAKNGKISSKLVQLGNKKERRFQEKDCIEFQNQIRRKTHSSVAKFGVKLHLYNHKLRLFEKITYKDEIVRIVNTEPITFLKIDGTILHPAMEEKIECSPEWNKKPYTTKKGFIEFRVPIPRNAEHTTYNILYNLINGLGPKNVQVFEQVKGDYFIRCRQGRLNLQQNDTDLLNRYVVDGEILQINEKEVQLQSSIVSMYIHLPKNLHLDIEQLAQDRSISTQEQLIETVLRGLHSFQNNS